MKYLNISAFSFEIAIFRVWKNEVREVKMKMSKTCESSKRLSKIWKSPKLPSTLFSETVLSTVPNLSRGFYQENTQQKQNSSRVIYYPSVTAPMRTSKNQQQRNSSGSNSFPKKRHTSVHPKRVNLLDTSIQISTRIDTLSPRKGFYCRIVRHRTLVICLKIFLYAKLNAVT